jgi:hypothetical protein
VAEGGSGAPYILASSSEYCRCTGAAAHGGRQLAQPASVSAASNTTRQRYDRMRIQPEKVKPD